MSHTPALFIGHGSPMNALQSNRYTRAWGQIGMQLPKPRALLVISAHWYFGATAVTAMAKPRTIHDFYGFPRELFAYQYSAPGAPDVAAEVAEIVKPLWVGLDEDQWGLDHGTWSVLAHMYPSADIPVVQLSINALKPLEHHLELAARLAPLRDSGVLIVASGNVVHNLRLLDRERADEGLDWAQRFDDAVCDQMSSDPSNILAVTGHPDYAIAVPTPEHFIPLLYVAGLASKRELPEAMLRGYSMASLSMTAYAVGAELALDDVGTAVASLPTGLPADDTNS